MNRQAVVFAFTGVSLFLPTVLASPLPERIEAIEHRTAKCFSPPPSINCEVSAVVRTGDQLILANDKPVPGKGGRSLFTVNLKGDDLSGNPTYLRGDTLKDADKYEALTTSLDGRYVIASTAFNKDVAAMSTIVYWPVGESSAAKALAAYADAPKPTPLREQISSAIGSPYYQIEGITIAPSQAAKLDSTDGQLMLGIRKHGKSSKEDFRFDFLLLSADVKFTGGTLVLQSPFKKVRIDVPEDYGDELGLSGIEYDRYNKDRLYAVTSLEKERKDAAGNVVGSEIGGFLWVLPFADGKPGNPVRVTRQDGTALKFSNKPEGVEVLDNKQILVVHDDDRVEVETSDTGIKRGDSEFGYSVITFPQSGP
ncbi:hypothetical protein [Pseudomonas sp. Hg5Tf]|uniref:Uncharacterized protein n=1 Tax=Pseudomonas sp. Hg7Tf TaxID=3236988 RepID=A0AB39I5R4_9PSED|nr:hypothetical protein [Pseudomonas sp. Hg5Tf]MDH2558268.1 hypothetical protein [Pseudomonas sp. Hg5Tf]